MVCSEYDSGGEGLEKDAEREGEARNAVASKGHAFAFNASTEPGARESVGRFTGSLVVRGAFIAGAVCVSSEWLRSLASWWERR